MKASIRCKVLLSRHKPDAHGECIDVLVELVKQANALYDHVVDTVDVELDLGSRVAVAETELGLRRRLLGQTLDHLVEVDPNAYESKQRYGVSGRPELLTLLRAYTEYVFFVTSRRPYLPKEYFENFDFSDPFSNSQYPI